VSSGVDVLVGNGFCIINQNFSENSYLESEVENSPNSDQKNVTVLIGKWGEFSLIGPRRNDVVSRIL
jgi:hypothetical protein